MTKDELWKIFCDKNPSFADENAEITMSGRGLKKFFDQTFEQGEKQGREQERDKAENRKKFDKMFGGLFG